MSHDPLALIFDHIRTQRAQIDQSLEDTDRTLRSTTDLLEKIERLRARVEASRSSFIAGPPLEGAPSATGTPLEPKST